MMTIKSSHMKGIEPPSKTQFVVLHDLIQTKNEWLKGIKSKVGGQKILFKMYEVWHLILKSKRLQLLLLKS